MASRSLWVLAVQRIRGNSYWQASGHARLNWLRPAPCSPTAPSCWNCSSRHFASGGSEDSKAETDKGAAAFDKGAATSDKEAATSDKEVAASDKEAATSDKEAATFEAAGAQAEESSGSDDMSSEANEIPQASSASEKMSDADHTPEEAAEETATGAEPDSADYATFTTRGGDAPPAPWRHAGEWVDLELERVGLPSHSSAQQGLKSPWGGEDVPSPDMNVLWPHAALSEHRSRPFMLPRSAQRGAGTTGRRGKNDEPEVDGTYAQGQLQANRERLTSLWRMSASHGISWDELDAAYVSFAKTGKKRYAEWSKASEDKLPKAVIMKQKSKDYAQRYLSRFQVSADGTPMERWPSRTRRLASRKYVEEKRRFLGPWAPGRLSVKLQQLVAARMIRRETEERVLGLKLSRQE
eukprot:TRINITY_DN1979_c0_g1_i1.p1 TRINITY_DN1979_c0_g1~~TRINITY_DN1979_c0_g1_i1.p1  ORF type:complete len:410 (+),score=76.77 TRINITY_DN1979_c0_g1_i1:106-1335(+)